MKKFKNYINNKIKNINLESIKKSVIKNKIYIICLSIILLSIISVIFQMIDRNKTLVINNEKINKNSDKIGVYITGEIKNEGVYYLENGARLYELLDLCGGITENADISSLNLAKKLNDSDMITIYKKKEKVDETDNEESYFVESVDKDEGKININTATKEQLKSLNGIGDQTAQKIINYRKDNVFLQIEDLLNVGGIGQSKFNNIKDDICV